MNRNLKALSLLGALVASSAFASEIRSPWISERGPLRYTFDRLHNEEGKWNMNSWSAFHSKEGHKAFLKHGTDTKPLTALIFNKSSFGLNEIFPSSDVPLNSENFNPFVRIAKISPRVAYYEAGATFGGRIDYPVWGTKGRIGLRGTLPVRRIEMEREDIDDTEEVLNSLLDAVSFRQVKKVTRTTNDVGSGTTVPSNGAFINPPGVPQDVVTQAWRFDFLQSIPNADGTPIVTFVASGPNTGVYILDNLISDNTAQPLVPAGPLQPVAATVTVGLTGVASGSDEPQTGSFQFTDITTPPGGLQPTANEVEFPGGPQALVGDFNALAAAPLKTAVQALPSNKVSYFQPGLDYSAYDINNTANNPFFVAPVAPVAPTPAGTCPVVCPVVCASTCFTAPTVCPTACPTACPAPAVFAASDAWVLFRYDVSGDDQNSLLSTSRATNLAKIIDDRVALFQQSPADFLAENDFDLNSHTRNGLGDIDLDLFYEHSFSKHLIGELMFGVRFPTADKAKLCKSPYSPQLGNNGHWEIKIGGDIAWQFASWVNLKFDTYYSFVLKDDEQRSATFQGAQIKNFGPCVKVDVDWGYYVGRLDFTFFHPKTHDIRSSLGYEFYYKTKDSVKFKCGSIQSWLGGRVDTTVGSPTFGQIIASTAALDTCLAEKNTESIGHKLRGETSCQINKWFEIFAGASYTFAGQNLMQDTDAHAGFNIRF